MKRMIMLVMMIGFAGCGPPPSPPRHTDFSGSYEGVLSLYLNDCNGAISQTSNEKFTATQIGNVISVNNMTGYAVGDTFSLGENHTEQGYLVSLILDASSITDESAFIQRSVTVADPATGVSCSIGYSGLMGRP